MKNQILIVFFSFSSFLAMAQQGYKSDFIETRDEAMKIAGLDKYETEKNNFILKKIKENLQPLKESLGDNYGGTWIMYDLQNNAYQVIGVKDKNLVNKAYTPDDISVTVAVKFSYRELEDMQARVWDLFNVSNSVDDFLVFGIAINEESNKLIVRGLPENFELIAEKIISAGVDMSAIRLEEQDGPATLMATLHGGSKIIASDDRTSGIERCTSGFNVTIDTIIQGAITAAHCSPGPLTKAYFPGATISTKGEYIGDYLADQWGNGIDAAIFGNVNNKQVFKKKCMVSHQP